MTGYQGRFQQIATRSRGGDGGTYVCGYVNGRNSFGGYVGQQPFMGMLIEQGKKAAFVVTSMGGTDEDTIVTNTMCGKYGMTEPYQ
jgi:hypothetical protein